MKQDIQWLITYGLDIMFEIRKKFKEGKETKTNEQIIINILDTISSDWVQRTYLIYNSLRTMQQKNWGFNQDKYNFIYDHYNELYYPHIDLFVLSNNEEQIKKILEEYMPKTSEPIEQQLKMICDEEFSDFEEEYEEI